MAPDILFKCQMSTMLCAYGAEEAPRAWYIEELPRALHAPARAKAWGLIRHTDCNDCNDGLADSLKLLETGCSGRACAAVVGVLRMRTRAGRRCRRAVPGSPVQKHERGPGMSNLQR